jgi:hypothetical protein
MKDKAHFGSRHAWPRHFAEMDLRPFSLRDCLMLSNGCLRVRTWLLRSLLASACIIAICVVTAGCRSSRDLTHSPSARTRVQLGFLSVYIYTPIVGGARQVEEWLLAQWQNRGERAAIQMSLMEVADPAMARCRYATEVRSPHFHAGLFTSGPST